MDLLEGETLKAIGRAGATTSEALRLITALADAVGAVHAAGIVHRDLKPENAMRLRDDGLMIDLLEDADGGWAPSGPARGAFLLPEDGPLGPGSPTRSIRACVLLDGGSRLLAAGRPASFLEVDLQAPERPYQRWGSFSGAVDAMAVFQNRIIAVTSTTPQGSFSLEVWDRNGQVRRPARLPLAHRGEEMSVSPRGVLAIGDGNGTVIAVDLKGPLSEETVIRFPGPPEARLHETIAHRYPRSHVGTVTGLAFAPSGRLFSLDGRGVDARFSNTLLSWSPEGTLTHLAEVPVELGRGSHLDVSPDGRLVAACLRRGRILVYAATPGPGRRYR
jgi:hypothetical protein